MEAIENEALTSSEQDSPATAQDAAEAQSDGGGTEDRVDASLTMIDDLLKIVGDAWAEVEELRLANQRLSGAAGTAASASAEPQPHSAEKLRGILLIDDSKLLLLRLRSILEPLGYSVVGSAEDGRRAIELAGRLRPQLAIIDYHMPGMNGLDCLRVLKQRLPGLRAIVCTGTTTAEQMRQFVAAGASEVVLKPIQLDVFLRAVKRCIGESDAGATQP